MSMLAFFPWLRIRDPIVVTGGSYTLVPFRRAVAPSGRGTPMQETYDAILRHYVQGRGLPVPQALLVQLGSHELTDDLNDEELASLFLFAKCFTFAALAARRFGPIHRYTNSDTCIFHVQRFTDPTGGFSYVIRRLDQSIGVYSPDDVFSLHHPLHVEPGEPPLDLPLLEALLRVAEDDSWPRFDDALFSFIFGNTDNEDIPVQPRLVNVVGAIQRVLDLNSATAGELAAAFLAIWQHDRHLPPPPAPRSLGARGTRKDGTNVPVLEAWIHDLYAYRHPLAHGKQETGHPYIWTLREHLLLGAYAFPRLVKLLLARQGFYTLTDQDQDEIAVFEHLMSAPDFLGAPDDQHNSLDTTWTRIYDRAMNTLHLGRIVGAQLDQLVELPSDEDLEDEPPASPTQ